MKTGDRVQTVPALAHFEGVVVRVDPDGMIFVLWDGAHNAIGYWPRTLRPLDVAEVAQ